MLAIVLSLIRTRALYPWKQIRNFGFAEIGNIVRPSLSCNCIPTTGFQTRQDPLSSSVVSQTGRSGTRILQVFVGKSLLAQEFVNKKETILLYWFLCPVLCVMIDKRNKANFEVWNDSPFIRSTLGKFDSRNALGACSPNGLMSQIAIPGSGSQLFFLGVPLQHAINE